MTAYTRPRALRAYQVRRGDQMPFIDSVYSEPIQDPDFVGIGPEVWLTVDRVSAGSRDGSIPHLFHYADGRSEEFRADDPVVVREAAETHECAAPA